MVASTRFTTAPVTRGTYEADSPEYWREVTEALSSAAAILLLGHGKGRANASHHWWPTSSSTARMSPPKWSQTCASTSIIGRHAGVTAGPILLRWSAAARLRGQSLGRTRRRETVSSRGFLASTARRIGQPRINVVQTLSRSHARAEYAAAATAARGGSVPSWSACPAACATPASPILAGNQAATRSLLEPAGASTTYQHRLLFWRCGSQS